MKVKRSIIVISCLCIMLLTACSSKESSDREYGETNAKMDMTTASNSGFTDYSTEAPAAMEEAYAEQPATGDTQANIAVLDPNRKLIRTINLNTETLEFDKTMQFVKQKIADCNGYVENSDIYGNRISYEDLRRASLTIRIPKHKLDEFVNAIGDSVTVTYRSENTRDVTLEYVDTDSRKKALQIQQDRLFELLEKSEDMESIIALESRISDITYELERCSSELRTYDNLVEYSTVSITINEVMRVSTVEVKPKTVGERMSQGLGDTLYNIKIGLQNFAVGFVSNLPYLIFWGAVIAVAVIIIVKKYKKNKRENTHTVATGNTDKPNQQ